MSTTSKPSILVLDTLDDRREIWHLLHKLPPRRRVEFLDWCCSQVSGPNGTRPIPSRLRMANTIAQAYRCNDADLRLTNELYTDSLALSCQWGLDLGRAAAALEQWVRRPASSRPCVAAVESFRTDGRPGNGRPA